MKHTRWLIASLFVLSSTLAYAQAKREAHVIYKDGFVIKGRVNEKVREFLWDRESGRSFPILSGDFFLDDYVRNIMFGSAQVHKVLQIKPGEVKEQMQVLRLKSIEQTRAMLDAFRVDSVSKWDEQGNRKVTILNTVKTGSAKTFEITQKIARVTPQHVLVFTDLYIWGDMYFATQEFNPEYMRKLLMYDFNRLKDLKDLKEGEKLLQIANFMQQAGWTKEAEAELKNIIENFPADKKIAQELLDKMKVQQADQFVESIAQAARVGQHNEALERLERYEELKYKDIIAPRLRTIPSDLRTDYDKAKANIQLAKKLLNELVMHTDAKKRPLWIRATEYIPQEINYDTVGKLEEFLQLAEQFETQRKGNLKLTQTAEEVLAVAISSWLQGKQAFDTDPKLALKLYHAREFLLDYLGNDDGTKRASLLSSYKRDIDLPVDILMRVIRMIPPVAPLESEKINTSVQSMTVELPDANGGSYLLQLPPDYHHQRAYPVLVLLQSSRDKAEDMMKRFADEAAKYGFVLVAPLWTGNGFGKSSRPTFGAKENALVLDTIRDVRRRLQVDSDRVFLFGWEDGGTGAFDVGLSHPDQFAGVAPMNGALLPFTRRFYWTNAQYLPFYVIDGERNGGGPKVMKDLFKSWTREPFACIYVEYKGRNSEWFSNEIPNVMNWMSRKKRHTPVKEMGQARLNGELHEEFRTSRASDNKFYWLSTDSLIDRYVSDHRAAVNLQKYRPATLQGQLSVGNKSATSGKEKIWNQLNLNVRGIRQLTFWITPEMMNLDKDLTIVVNGRAWGGNRKITPSVDTLLEELYRSGDRQRLYIGKIEIPASAF